ncbi:AT-rich interactive domain-containing protein 4B isoform X1 [Poecilia reticulata]|uniref:AT-rich interactive domain-containing protein 4B n=1 Tax=Poecilia reticulata TaxID=8081 RepID=A0A3P9NQE1_POERE|nr:PREDICTED: AT-rich interactive domain-containing protein 4B isoform X1 [Poecilia reticulata]XP_008428479.1 PREDICTED: AT-rich interactive domain-containing protein 4B isoform X1 [Poecilia reticulata]XP_008428480.1 PREDICTED: AT-rich interactive domain-containing protein 4B isoform X1 [Poecilia reticulata]XP_017164351.1 PREDICTED: AT-rich interactive domain-containing protein 4B isoform X1 [Poecilia reticulata]
MKTLEEPPYLTVGTDVSAKYRGAFCEAKIKTAKRLVKAKVTFKPDLSTAEVHDENIKGPLKVGAVVEVKNQDGVYQEATINKLTDASIYTVVFDDGDEKTLRRSSLCLKGARHFAESETLDRLPLTNPEHFGTPVIGKKGNRGRRSNPIQEEELSSSSSEEEESDQRQNEDLFGKVVCVEGVAAGDKKKSTWYPALVISPDCHEDMTVKKDNIFVRSFKDGKFYMVLRKDVNEINSEIPPKADAGLKAALDAALEFQRKQAVPGSWKTEVKEESSSSEEDDEDEEDEQEEDASGEEEEVSAGTASHRCILRVEMILICSLVSCLQEEVEPFPEERENFLQQLYKFMEDRGTSINKRPVLGYRNLNLFKLYRLVHKLGGFDNIESGSVWKQVYQDLGIPVLNSAAGYNVKCAYRKYLYGFEEYCTSTAITFKMDLPLKQGPKREVKSEEEAGRAAPTASISEEQKTQTDGELCTPPSVLCKEEKTDFTQIKSESEPSKTEGKDSDDDDDEEEEEKEEEEGGASKADADEGSSTSRLGGDNIKTEQDDEQESKDNSGDDSSQEGEEGEEFECYPPGMKVQVRYGRGRTLKTYEATVKEADVEGGEVLYLVHYCGWNVRYDEWIKADKIVRPANKNVPKIKHRKKIKNKAERERDRLERLGDREVLGPNRVPHSKCGLSHDVFSKMNESEDKGTQQPPVKSIEITSILNGLQASEMSTDESECEDEEQEHDEEDQPSSSARRGPTEPPQASERWESGVPSEGSKASSVSGKSLDAAATESQDVGKHRGQPETEREASTRKRKSDGAAERNTKGLSKVKTRNTRSADWLPSGSPRKLEDRGALSSSSSEDESAALANIPAEENERSRAKTKGSPSKKYNGMKEKSKAGRQAGFWEIPEKKAKPSGNAEEKAPAVRPKGQKDVWSSIQAQWPKKTLKELFSDSDTEAANSPPPPVSSCLDESGADQEAGPEDEGSEEQLENDKLQEFPSSGSNSVLNTPPTTPESPSGGGSAVEETSQAPPPSPPPSLPPVLPSEPVSHDLPPDPTQEEAAGGRSETDSSTVEVESLGGELQELPQDDGTGSPSKVYNVSLSCNSSSSLELSSSSQQDSEQKSKASVSQKRQKESQTGGVSKKHKSNRKSLGVPPKRNRKAANSSDSEDQSVVEGSAKSAACKNTSSDLKAAASPKYHGRSPPSSHKYHKQGDPDHSQHRDSHVRSPRIYKWSFQMSDLEKMSSLERISFLQEKLQDIRNHYLSLKSEVASIDRRRKRMKKKERESAVAVSSSSSSSPSSSSLTAAVMLTLADPPVPSSSSSSQNSGVSVECR